MKEKIKKYVKSEIVLVIAALLAVISSIIVPTPQYYKVT